MKTITCRAMGGMCDESITAETPDEMIGKGMDHLRSTHPDMAANIEAMGMDAPVIVEWKKKFNETWAATPDAA